MTDTTRYHEDGGSPEPSSGVVDPARRSSAASGLLSVVIGAPRQRSRGGRHKRKRKTVIGRHPVVLALALVLTLVAGSAGGYLWWLNHQLGNIQRVDAGISENPAIDGHEGGKPLNILLLGADNGNAQTESVADDLADGKWTPFEHRSDTMMVVHIPADRKSVQLVSIPRDTWVPIDGYPYTDGHGKINSAFAYGGPSLARQTVEDLTGIHIDHLAIIDWAGFKDLTSALGGVRVYVPDTFYDDKQDITWEKGWHDLEGKDALSYVRTRHGLANGDFDRIKRQQNFLRATMGQLLSSGTTHNVVKFTKVVGAMTKYLVVDNTWDNGEIKSLALSMRNLHSHDVDFLTAPFGSYDRSPDGQSIVRLAPKKSTALFAAVEDDDVQHYLEENPKSALAGAHSIN
ncbi:MAG TPA: LCP family protein [Nocardioidaceae bacterium]|jgi:LCP family protein required for cell wall assembly